MGYPPVGVGGMDTGEGRSFGELLRGMRTVAGLTQEELAERAGLSVRGIRYLEHGSRRPYPGTIRRLGDALGASSADREVLLTAGRRPARTAMALAALASGRGDGGVPAPPSPLIGRDVELADLRRLLIRADVRAVTVTGPGGVGKTRLAIEAAIRLPHDTAETAWVALASLHDPDLVPAAVARALGVVQTGAVDELDAISQMLTERPTVLVLDNVEHLLDAVGFLAMLLSRCSAVKILATSRAALRLSGEHEFLLAPFLLPAADRSTPVHAIAANPAVDLFMRRAQAVRPPFTLTPSNAIHVATLCRRLDGLPLAIELAAARIRVLSPQDMLTRMQPRRLPFLTGGAAGNPSRHSTMRNTLDWSYELLEADRQATLRCLAVFRGGFTLATADAIVRGHGSPPDDIVGAVEDLQRNSLIAGTEANDHGVRLSMLETIREYALDRLAECGETADLQRAHAQHFVTFAEQAARHFYTPTGTAWITRLAIENDNLRAAMRWAVQHRDADTALRLGAALWSFWYVHGQITEGRTNLAAALKLVTGTVASVPHARALLGAGQLALAHGNYRAGSVLLDRSIALHRALDDGRGTAEALLAAGFAARLSNRTDDARPVLFEALTLATATGHQFVTAAALHHLGMLAAIHDDHDEARRLLQDSLTRYRQMGLQRFVALVVLSLGEVALAVGDTTAARELFHASLTGMLDAHAILDIPTALEDYADLAAADGDLERAVRLAGAAAGLRTVMGSQPWPDARQRRSQWLADARKRLPDGAYAAAWTDGQSMNLEDAAIETLDDPH
jgi:predicted ATPase/transcriptional regulator with XRE-family HTH domain